MALLLARGARPTTRSYAASVPPRASPADLAAARQHQGIAAYIGEAMLSQSLSAMQLSNGTSGTASSMMLWCGPITVKLYKYMYTLCM